MWGVSTSVHLYTWVAGPAATFLSRAGQGGGGGELAKARPAAVGCGPFDASWREVAHGACPEKAELAPGGSLRRSVKVEQVTGPAHGPP